LRVYLESLGCRLNAAEVESLARQIVGSGHEVVDDPTGADTIVLNSCAVTAQASRRSRRRLHTLHRQSPDARIGVTGCWATEDVSRAEGVEGVQWVLANADKTQMAGAILGATPAAPAPWLPGRWGHTRAFLGVQEGCDHACTYCITRLLRGRARSRPLADAVQQVQHFVAQGAQEVILTGICLGSYGSDLDLGEEFPALVSAIMRDTDVPRLRLSSIELWDVTPKLLALWEDSRLCGQLHVPLQSGSDSVLKRMGRRGTVSALSALVRAARDIRPDLAITTDVITGFPGETRRDFDQTVSLVEDLRFARLHVFPYSERAGTAATRLPGMVPMGVRRARARQLRELGAWLARAYREQFVGQRLQVLWMGQGADGAWQGLTDTYLKVRARSERDLYNRITGATITSAAGEALVGDVVPCD